MYSAQADHGKDAHAHDAPPLPPAASHARRLPGSRPPRARAHSNAVVALAAVKSSHGVGREHAVVMWHDSTAIPPHAHNVQMCSETPFGSDICHQVGDGAFVAFRQLLKGSAGSMLQLTASSAVNNEQYECECTAWCPEGTPTLPLSLSVSLSLSVCIRVCMNVCTYIANVSDYACV